MVWTAPMTAVANTPFTSAQWNTHVRDNLNHCAPAAATTGARWITTSGFFSLVERAPYIDFTIVNDTTANTSYEDLDANARPNVTTTGGLRAIVTLGAIMSNSTAGWGARMSVAVAGAATFEPSDNNSFLVESGNASDAFKGTWTTIFDEGMAAGELIWTAKYRSVGGATASFDDRLLAVIPF